jgi:hypothetical protein
MRRAVTAGYARRCLRACCRATLLGMLLLLGAPAAALALGFGVEPGSFTTTLSGGEAGQHADLTVGFTIKQEPPGAPAGYLKDIGLSLPAGLVGVPSATTRCVVSEVDAESCSSEAAVGVAEVITAQPPRLEAVNHSVALVYNVTPYPDEPAAYAFDAGGLPVRLDASLEAQDAYGLSLSATDLSDSKPLISARITLWGVPADHNGPGPLETTSNCGFNEVTELEECKTYGGQGSGARLPFLSDPVSCGASPKSSLTVDSWQEPGAFSNAFATFGEITECGALGFEPSSAVDPGAESEAREPAGYEIAVGMPVDASPDGRAAADLKSARVQLPPGTVISPSAGNGLQACSEKQFEPATGGSSKVAECPAGSEIGSVSLTTPLLAEPLKGQMFLGTPACAPCSDQDAQEGKMIRLLVQGERSGVIVKLRGSVSVSASTGLLTATIEESPQLPVQELKLDFRGGQRALLANPSECGTPLHSTAQLTPYSSETASEVTGAPFTLTGCQASQFAPTFTAGTVSDQAAGASSTVVSVGRADQDQILERFTVQMPPGLLGLLSKVPACLPSQAQQMACGGASRVGSVQIAAGPGKEPLILEGTVFLTGPYEGAPFGLSIVAPAQAGPIDLGVVNIQAGIEVNPSTAALTIASGALPQSLAGVPLQIRTLNLNIDREGFMVNPTNCRPMAIAARIAGAQSSSATAATHFQAAGCAKLPFKPHLSALADAKATRIGGAYVHVKVASGAGQANIAKVKLDLPKALPSRLTTLQGACTEAVFNADPAGCPSSSLVGTGAVTTPFLRAVMTGPVYLVSHGGRAFPDLDAVLEGEGVTLKLVGTSTFANGSSAEAFRSLPDAPISTLDLMFPEGPHSAFAANANLCNRALKMPTQITGQNGAVVKQLNQVGVSGCSGKSHLKLNRKEAKR